MRNDQFPVFIQLFLVQVVQQPHMHKPKHNMGLQHGYRYRYVHGEITETGVKHSKGYKTHGAKLQRLTLSVTKRVTVSTE